MANAITQTVRFAVEGAEYVVSWDELADTCQVIGPDGVVHVWKRNILDLKLESTFGIDAVAEYETAREAFQLTDDAAVCVFGGYAIREALKARGGVWLAGKRAWLLRRSDALAAIAETGAKLKTGARFTDPSHLWVAE